MAKSPRGITLSTSLSDGSRTLFVEGIQSPEHWGKVICRMEGHKEIAVRGKTFAAILSEAHDNPKMRKYLQFICRKFRGAISDSPETQGPDLAGFCLKCHFDPGAEPKKGYVREFGW